MKRIRVSTLMISLFIPLITGAASAAISSEAMALYANMNKPPGSPPAWLFPVAWTILYIMMGLSLYFIIEAYVEPRLKKTSIIIYAVGLAMNFMWSIVFFNWSMYLFAFIWLMILWCVVIITAYKFYRISKIAGCLLVPYIVWLTFAAYLNLGSYILN